MGRLKWFLTIVLTLGAFLLIGTACTPGELKALEGTLQNIDTVSGNVTVRLKDGSTQTYNFNDVSVSTVRKALGKASIEIGDNVTIRCDRHGKIRRVETRVAEVSGVIKSLGTANVTVTNDNNRDITLKVADNTSIRLGEDARGTFADLRVGMHVSAKYDVSVGNAILLRIETEDDDDEEEDSTRGGKSDSERPPGIPHVVAGREDCVSCHGQNGVEPFPKDHAGRTSVTCQGCHQPRPAGEARGRDQDRSRR